MNKIASVAVLLCLSFLLGACTFDEAITQMKASFGDTDAMVATTEVAVQPAAAADPNAIPWQLTPASSASRAQGETTVVMDRPGKGRIRGTETALAQLDERVVPFRRNGPVVSACKEAFERQAKAKGAYSVEANAAGPERKVPQGKRQQVFFRIFYADPQDAGVEVRQASIACTIGKSGDLIEASVV